MDPVVIFWIILAIVLVIIEGITTTLVTIWPAFGAVAAAIAAACGVDWLGQVLIFLVVSLVLLIATRPLAKKLLKKDQQPTNSDRLIGQTALVTEDILPLESKGRVKIDGKYWAARSGDGQSIASGTVVTVQGIEGVKLIVLSDNRQ